MPSLLGNMLQGKPADPRPLQPTLPAEAAEAILRALRPSPEERFGSAVEFAEALS
jgi:hypothetical protein